VGLTVAGGAGFTRPRFPALPERPGRIYAKRRMPAINIGEPDSDPATLRDNG